MYGVEAGFDALLFLRFQIGLGDAAVAAFVNEFLYLWICGSGFERQRMLGRKTQERRAHQGIRTRGEHAHRIRFTLDGEINFQTLAAPDPVALHGLDRVRPAGQLVEPGQQFVGVIGDLEEPLRNLALLNRCAGAPAAAVDHLLVGKHGLIDRIPVHDGILAIRESLLEQVHEHALFVDVVIRLACRELARPVDGVAHRAQLLAHVFDVGIRPLRRRGVVLDCRVLGGQAERIPTHRLQDILAEHALIAADHIADGVVAHMAHMQRSRWVWEHRQAIEFRLRGIFLRHERLVVVPELLRGGFHRLEFVGCVHRGLDRAVVPAFIRNPCNLPQRSIRANPGDIGLG